MKHAKFAFGLLGLVFLLAGATPTARAATVDLATLCGDYTATNGTTLTGTLVDNCKISVADGASITLNGATIRGANSTSFQWAGLTCEGDATIVLSGTNVVRGFHSSHPAIHVPANKTLTIRGDGALTASGNGNSAGIGGGYQIDCGNIFVEGGTITATGGFGAGIGGGYDAPCGEIRITGGTVTATGGNGAAGIGGGYNPDGSTNGLCGDIAIMGGIVTAKGGDNGAGIGGGNKVPCGDIALAGGIITTTGGKKAAGVGGGWMASCGEITVEFGIDMLAATAGDSASPIGMGSGGTCSTVSIADGLNDMTRGATRRLTSWNGFLASITHDATALDGMTLFGTLTDNYKISIADGATVTLDGVTILGTNNSSYNWAGITCEGDATIALSGANTVRGFDGNYPGIYVPAEKTLTIRGAGLLTAGSNGSSAGIGGGHWIKSGKIIIQGGSITAIGGYYAAGIGGGYYGGCDDISIQGGSVVARGIGAGAGIGGGGDGDCGDITIGEGITLVVATKGDYGAATSPIGTGAGSTCGRVSIAESLEQITSDDGATLTIQPRCDHTITWLDDIRGVIDTTEVAEGVVPTHAEPVSTRTAEAPYRYVFAGWTPEPVAATNDATYAATFNCVADLSLLTGDWSPADGDILLPGATPYAVTIPAGATVTIDGVALSAEDFSPSAPVFADGGSAFISGFAPGGDGTWSLEAYGDLASGTAEGVTADMVQVYAADTVEGLATAEPLSSGVTLKDTQNVVKATLEVAPPTTSETQFFRVNFTNE